jgi:uncharacterized protein YegJ (DUF2314 family)
MKSFVALFLSLLFSYSAFAQHPETLIRGGFDQKEMDKAIARAKKEIDSFIKELAKPKSKNHAIKVPITDKNGTEFFWLTQVKFKDGVFEGTVISEPTIVKNVKFMDRRKVKKADVVDWKFVRDDWKTYGHYTIRPLMKTMPKEEVEWLRSILAEP